MQANVSFTFKKLSFVKFDFVVTFFLLQKCFVFFNKFRMDTRQYPLKIFKENLWNSMAEKSKIT